MSVRVVSTPLRGTLLTEPAISGVGVSDWYVRRPSGAREWTRRGEEMRASLVCRDWLSAIAPAMSATGVAAQRLERAAESGFAVTTGQQPGLFGGPLYTWWKALSALALADHLELLTGRAIVPIFWAATDDSDFVEAASTAVALHDRAVRIGIDTPPETGSTLSEMPLGDVSEQLAQLTSASGSAPHAGILDIVRRAYSPKQTLGGAYISLLSSVLNPLGIAVIDASHNAVKAAAFPVIRDALKLATAVESALESRTAELTSAGHSVQVRQVKGRSLVFAEKDGQRNRVTTCAADTAATATDLRNLGPNVLLRPIVERSIIPTVAYVGGPAEIAYFAQISAVAEVLDTPVPLVVPRWAGMVVEPRIDRILEKHGLSIDDLRDPHAATTKMARASLPLELRSSLDNIRESIQSAADAIAAAEGSGLVPSRVVQGLRHNVARQIDRLERRYAAAVKRRGNADLTDVASARAALFPLDAVQERSLNIVPLLARHGEALIHEVMREIEPHAIALA